MRAVETSRSNGHSISIVWNDKDRETYKSRVDTTPGHVLWGSGQCQVQCGQEGLQEVKSEGGGPGRTVGSLRLF